MSDSRNLVNELLSRGLVAFAGNPGRLDNKSAEERVVAALGSEDAIEMLPRIKEIFIELNTAEPPLWSAESETHIWQNVMTFLQSTHSELSTEAAKAAANRFAFDWR